MRWSFTGFASKLPTSSFMNLCYNQVLLLRLYNNTIAEQLDCLLAFRQAGLLQRVDCLALVRNKLSVFTKDTTPNCQVGNRIESQQPFRHQPVSLSTELQRWTWYFLKVPRYRYRYFLKKSTVGTGSGTISKQYWYWGGNF